MKKYLVDQNEGIENLVQFSLDDFDNNFFVSVFGAVRQPDDFMFGIGMTLQDVLLQAGGLTPRSQGSRIEVSRVVDYDISTDKLLPKRTVVKNIFCESRSYNY